MYGVYLLHGWDVNIPKVMYYYPCLTSAEYYPKRKKLKGYQKK